MEEGHPENVEQQQQQQQQPVLELVEQQQQQQPVLEFVEQQQQQQHPVLENVEQQQQQEQHQEQQQQQPLLDNVEQQQQRQEGQQQHQEGQQQHQEQQQPVLGNVEQQQQHQEQQPVLGNVEQLEHNQVEQQQHQQQQQQQHHHVQEIFEEEEEIDFGEAMRVMEVGCASWIIQMEETLDNSRWAVVPEHGKKPPSIYRVPDRIKRGNTEAYRPKLVSMGPLRYGEEDLMPMERHKKEAVLQRVKRFGKPLVEYLASIQEVVEELLGVYDGLDEKWRNEGREEFVQMMLMDGCFLLESIQRYFDYPSGNPVFSYHGCLTLYTAIKSDSVVLENQLPLLVLERILAVERETAPSAAEVNDMVLIFLGFSNWPDLDINGLGQHPLDLLHHGMCGPEVHYVGEGWDNTMPSASELHDSGIQFKVSKSNFIHDIRFRNGILSLPVFSAHDDTEKQILNLLAYEKVFPSTGHEVLSYICFMDNLVNTGSDIELLRSKGVIKNLLSSDDELAQQINRLGSGALMSPLSMLDDVQRMVSQHCKEPWNKWRATFAHTYLSNPWVFISLLVALILLVAAILQTVYTIVPYYNKS